MTLPADAERIPTDPKSCPFCQSKAITTNRKESTYWRCERCGEMWHPERLLAANTYGRSRR